MSTTTIPAGFRALPLGISQLSLAATLKCGQSFRWSSLSLSSEGEAFPSPIEQPTHEYRFCLNDRVICLRQSIDQLFYRAIYSQEPSDSLLLKRRISTEEDHEVETLAFLRDYFQLDVDLTKLYDEWSNRDSVFGNLRHRFSGIRMLRQDPWENLVSFICSSNNNITRISKMVQSLCSYFSPTLVQIPHPASFHAGSTSVSQSTLSYHPFPPPSKLADPSVSAILRKLGFGYRAEYIQRTAQMLMEEHGTDAKALSWLGTLRSMNTQEARSELLKFCGVGRKVADCILLMSLDKREVIPVDTHVHQIAIKHYGFRAATSGGKGAKATMSAKLYEEVNSKLAAIWGEYAGWAHSILFTADLKSFSTYGLLTPSPSVSPQRPSLSSTPSQEMNSPSPSPSKKRKAELVIQKLGEIVSSQSSFDGDLADRVKRRRSSRNLT